MRLKLTFLLLALNLALFGFIFYLERAESARERFEATSRTILSPDFVEGISRIRIESNAIPQPWTLQKSDDGWQVTSPFQWEANVFAVDRLLFQLRALSWVSRFSVEEVTDTGQSLERYGLQTPSVSLHLTSANGPNLTLPIGLPTEIGNRLYVMSPDGENILVVERDILDGLDQDLETFLDRNVFNLGIEEVRALQVQDRSNGSARVRVVRSGPEWQFVSPIETAADPEEVRRLISQWQAFEIDGFVDPATYGDVFDNPSLRFSLEGLNERETLIFSSNTTPDDAGMLLARREAFPTAFRVPEAFLLNLKTVQDRLREKQFLRNLPKTWTSLEIRMDDANTTLQRLENGQWQVVFTDDNGDLQSLPAEPRLVSELQDLFPSISAVRFVSDAPSEADLLDFGILDPQREVTFRFDNREPVTLTIGDIAPREALFFANTNQSGSVFLIRPYILSRLPLDPLHYRNRTLYELPDTAQVDGINLTYLPENRALLQERSDLDPAVLGNIARFFQETRFKDFVQENFTGSVQLDAETPVPFLFALSADIKLPGSNDPATKRTFLLSPRIGGGTQFIADPQTRLVGILPDFLLDAIDPVLPETPRQPTQSLLDAADRAIKALINGNGESLPSNEPNQGSDTTPVPAKPESNPTSSTDPSDPDTTSAEGSREPPQTQP